jgi:hypothetical protein
MTKQQIKDYLEKYSLTTKEKLAEHITQLKRNTKPNLELVSELNYVLVDEENLFFNVFSREKDNHKEQINNTVYLYNVSSLSDGNMIRGEKIVGDINKPPQKRLTLHIENVINDAQQEKKSAMFLDEVLESTQNFKSCCRSKEECYCGKYSEENKVKPNCLFTKCGQGDCISCYPNSAQKENTKGHSTRLKANTPLVVSEKGKELVFDKDCNLLGEKTNKNKPQISLLFKQFPKALEAIAKCSEYGHQKYKESDFDFLNYQRVYGGSKTYADAGLRHRLEQGNDLESGLPHTYHVAWNALAELQLWIQENK